MLTTADLPGALQIDWAVTRPTCDNPHCAACARTAFPAPRPAPAPALDTPTGYTG